MSRWAMEWAHEQAWAKRLDPAATLVLEALAYRANWKTGISTAGVDDIVDRTRLSDHTVRRAMRRVRDSGVLAFREKRGCACWWWFPASPNNPGNHDRGNPGNHDRGNPGNHDRTTPVTVAGNPGNRGSQPRSPLPGNQVVNQYENQATAFTRAAHPRDGTFTTDAGDTFIPGSGWVRHE